MPVNALDSMGRTALVYAIVSEKQSCVEVLLKKGADVNIAGMQSSTILLIKTLRSMLPADQDGRTPVHWACFQQKPQMLKMLLGRGADVFAKV